MAKRLPPLNKQTAKIEQPAPEPYFSLFKKENGVWVRCRTTAFKAKLAVKVFGPTMCSNPYNFHIKAVKLEDTQVNVKGNKYFGKVHYNQFEKYSDNALSYQSMTEPLARK